jgi:hypothetical protein
MTHYFNSNLFRIRKELLFILLILLVNCSYSGTTIRDIRPVEKEDNIIVSGFSLIRTAYCDISMMHISDHQWKRIVKSNIFSKSDKTFHRDSFMDGDAFYIIIHNTTSGPVFFEKSSILFKNPPFTNNTPWQKNKTKSNKVSKSILIPRRIIAGQYPKTYNDIKNNTIPYLLPHITSGYKVIYFVFFPTISSGKKSFTIAAELRWMNIKKRIDFHFTINDYRTSGKYFRKPFTKRRKENYELQ